MSGKQESRVPGLRRVRDGPSKVGPAVDLGGVAVERTCARASQQITDHGPSYRSGRWPASGGYEHAPASADESVRPRLRSQSRAYCGDPKRRTGAPPSPRWTAGHSARLPAA